MAGLQERRRLDIPMVLGYLLCSAEVAQLVEQGTENPRVGGSIPSLGTIDCLVSLPAD